MSKATLSPKTEANLHKAGKVLGYIAVGLFFAAVILGILLLISWFAVWLIAVLTTGAVVLSVWQGLAGVFLLLLIGALLGLGR